MAEVHGGSLCIVCSKTSLCGCKKRVTELENNLYQAPSNWSIIIISSGTELFISNYLVSAQFLLDFGSKNCLKHMLEHYKKKQSWKCQTCKTCNTACLLFILKYLTLWAHDEDQWCSDNLFLSNQSAQDVGEENLISFCSDPKDVCQSWQGRWW